MILTETALSQINNQETRLRLGLALGFTEAWISALIKKNKVNGDLTTAAALRVIKEETGLTEDEILCDEELVRQ